MELINLGCAIRFHWECHLVPPEMPPESSWNATRFNLECHQISLGMPPHSAWNATRFHLECYYIPYEMPPYSTWNATRFHLEHFQISLEMTSNRTCWILIGVALKLTMRKVVISAGISAEFRYSADIPDGNSRI